MWRRHFSKPSLLHFPISGLQPHTDDTDIRSFTSSLHFDFSVWAESKHSTDTSPLQTLVSMRQYWSINANKWWESAPTRWGKLASWRHFQPSRKYLDIKPDRTLISKYYYTWTLTYVVLSLCWVTLKIHLKKISPPKKVSFFLKYQVWVGKYNKNCACS